MARSLADREIRPLTADEVMRMAEVGILAENERVELLDGVLTRMSPKSPEHQEVIARLVQWLITGSRLPYRVRTETPIIVPDVTALPEPDVVVLDASQSPKEHPRTAHLVIEVAVTSQTTDVARKPTLYAAAGVAEYWVIDVPGRRLIRFTEPDGGRYTHRDEQAGHEAALHPAPRCVDVDPLDLAALFAGL